MAQPGIPGIVGGHLSSLEWGQLSLVELPGPDGELKVTVLNGQNPGSLPKIAAQANKVLACIPVSLPAPVLAMWPGAVCFPVSVPPSLAHHSGMQAVLGGWGTSV